MLNSRQFLIRFSKEAVLNIQAYPFFGEWHGSLIYEIKASDQQQARTLYFIMQASIDDLDYKIKVNSLKIPVSKIYGNHLPETPVFKMSIEEEISIINFSIPFKLPIFGDLPQNLIAPYNK